MSKSIASLLTFAVTTSLALANGGEGDKKNPFQGGSSWKPGQGLQLAQGEDYSLNLAGQLQAGWSYSSVENGDDTNSFEIPRARLAFTGHAISKDLTYRLMLDGTDTDGALKDGWAQWAFSKSSGGNLSLRMGQGLSGYGLESTSSETGLFFVERSTSSRTFGQDRSLIPARGSMATTARTRSAGSSARRTMTSRPARSTAPKAAPTRTTS